MTDTGDLPFSRDEYAARLGRVRQQMEAAGVEVLLTTVPENIVYLTDYSTLGYFTYQVPIVSLEQEPILLTRAINAEKAQVGPGASSWATRPSTWPARPRGWASSVRGAARSGRTTSRTCPTGLFGERERTA